MFVLTLQHPEREVPTLTAAAKLTDKRATAASNTLDPLMLFDAAGMARALGAYAREAQHFIASREPESGGIEFAEGHRRALAVGLRIMHNDLGKISDKAHDEYLADTEALLARKQEIADLFLRVRPDIGMVLVEDAADDDAPNGEAPSLFDQAVDDAEREARRDAAAAELMAPGVPLDEFIARTSTADALAPLPDPALLGEREASGESVDDGKTARRARRGGAKRARDKVVGRIGGTEVPAE